MMVGRRFAPYSLYFVVRIDLSTLKAHPKTAQSKHDLCVGLLSSKHIEGGDHMHKGTSINHVDGFLDFFDPPSPHVDHFTK